MKVNAARMAVADEIACQGSVQYLETKTRAYWQLSTDAQGRGNKITTADAIDYCRELAKVLGPARRLKAAVIDLSDEIIRGQPRKKKKNNILRPQFPTISN